MAVITKIQQKKDRSDNYHIYLDGRYELSLSGLDLSNSGWRVGNTLTDDEAEAWRRASASSKAHGQALKYLSARRRSVKEVIDYLSKKDFNRTDIDLAVNKLLAMGLLNDQELGQAWVHDRVAFKPRSRIALTMELRSKGVSDSDARSVMADLSRDDYLAMLVGLINKKRRESRYQDSGKLMSYLARQGYAYGDIRDALAAADVAG